MPVARHYDWPLVIPPAKTKYILENETKAGLFRSLGFRSDRAHVLVSSLLEHGGLHLPSEIIADQYGLRFSVVGRLTCPDGTAPFLKTSWIKLHDNTHAHLITAFLQRSAGAGRPPSDG